MRKLTYELNLRLFRNIKEDIVPALFTEHQFSLIEKKALRKRMSPSERNEFSRAVSKKMRAISRIMEKETGGIFIYGKEKIMESRLKQSLSIIKKFSRKFKNRHIIISGSFLYNNKCHDIDIFVVSKYEKEDYHLGRFHINYLPENIYTSLFFASISRLCISNRKICPVMIKENIGIGHFISLYQELFNDLDRKFKGVRATLRDFLLHSSFISNSPIPDSLELRDHADSILKSKSPKEAVKKLFVSSVILGVSRKKSVSAMKSIINSYNGVMKEYSQHKPYYLDLMQPFKEVVSIES